MLQESIEMVTPKPVELMIDLSSIFMAFVKKDVRKSIFLLTILLTATIIQSGFTFIWIYRNFTQFQNASEVNAGIWRTLNGIKNIYNYLFLIFGFRWSYLNQFSLVWSRTGLFNDRETNNYISQRRRINRVMICLLAFINAVTITILSYNFNQPLMWETFVRWSTARNFIINIVHCAIIIAISDFLLQIINHIDVVFMYVNRNLETILNGDSEALIERLQKLRQIHFYGSELVRIIDKFLHGYIVGIYIIIVPFMLVGLYRLLYLSENVTDTFISICAVFISVSMSSVLTFNAVNVNSLASKHFNVVYQLSFANKTFDYYRENTLLMYRMGRHDIGLTFANLFTISPSFITSLLTLCVTFILAFPSINLPVPRSFFSYAPPPNLTNFHDHI